MGCLYSSSLATPLGNIVIMCQGYDPEREDGGSSVSRTMWHMWGLLCWGNRNIFEGKIQDLENTKLLTVVEPKWFEQGVKETIYIRLKDPNLNSDWGRYSLSSVWDILFKTIGTTTPTASEIFPREPSGCQNVVQPSSTKKVREVCCCS